MCGCLSHAPYPGPGLQPRHVPWLGIKPTTLLFTCLHSVHWATPARALFHFFNGILWILIKFSLSTCSFYGLYFGVIPKTSFWTQGSQRFSLFSSENFIVLGFTLRPMIFFELTFVYDVMWYDVIFVYEVLSGSFYLYVSKGLTLRTFKKYIYPVCAKL